MRVNLDFVSAIIPKVTAGISIPCSSFIICEAYSDHRRGKGTAIQRALVGMCVVDIFASIGWFLSTWAVLEGTAPMSKGNVATCNFQGFLLQLSVGAPLYNCSLSLYYLLIIKHNWSNAKLRRIENWVHGVIITFIVGTSILGLPLTMYNTMGDVCWVKGSPRNCGNSNFKPSDIPCDRGDWAWLFGMTAFYAPLWVCIVLTMLAMALIYCQVRRTFRKNDRHRFEANQRQGSADFDVSFQSPSEGMATGHPTAGNGGASVQIKSERTNRFAHVRTGVTGEVEDLDPAHENDNEEDEQQQNGMSYEDQTLECSNHKEVNESAIQTRNDAYLASFPLSVSSEASNGIGLKSGWRTVATRASMPSSTLPSMTAEPGQKPSAKQRQKRTQAEKARKKKESLFATQAILYSASFFITWLPATLAAVTHWLGAGSVAIDMIATATESLQGFWNMLIFIRSRPSSQAKLRKFFGRPLGLILNVLPAMTDEFAKSSSSPLSDSDQVGSTGQRQSSANDNNGRISMKPYLAKGIASEDCVLSDSEAKATMR